MTVICTVTNDLTYDQRMQRICDTLARNGYVVELVGRALPHSAPLDERSFRQRRLRCHFHSGFLFYLEFNLRLFFFLLRARYDAVCSVDLDTLPAGCLATLLRGKKRVFDAHEYFTEVPEVTHRPFVKWVWGTVARLCLPFYRHAYTVGPALAAIFEKKYGIPFGVVRNMPLEKQDAPPAFLSQNAGPRILLYQGALNEGRGIEPAIEAMRHLEGVELWLAGEGDRSVHLRKMAAALGVQDKVRFLGYVKPTDLPALTSRAWLGLNLLENKGLSYYYSLANKFFDYVQARVPVLTMDFPEYRALNLQHEVALLMPELNVENLISAVRLLLENKDLYARLQQETQIARREWTWENEEKTLLGIWENVKKN